MGCFKICFHIKFHMPSSNCEIYSGRQTLVLIYLTLKDLTLCVRKVTDFVYTIKNKLICVERNAIVWLHHSYLRKITDLGVKNKILCSLANPVWLQES
jgi:hypothetical protein